MSMSPIQGGNPMSMGGDRQVTASSVHGVELPSDSGGSDTYVSDSSGGGSDGSAGADTYSSTADYT